MTLKEELAQLLRLARRSQYLDVCANTCQTRHDFEEAEEAEDKYEEAREAFERRLDKAENALAVVNTRRRAASNK